MRLEDLSFQTGENVYAPREDSWLLAHAILKNKKIVRGKKCLDMGCGSGIQTAAMLLVGGKEETYSDIAPEALHATASLVERYFPSAKTKPVQGDLFQHVKGTFDVIAFNPPYVPSTTIRWRDTDGGKKGREIIDAFLEKLADHLKPGGHCFLLQSSLNIPEMTEQKMKKLGMTGKIIATQKLFMEELQVWHLQI